jgi:hypothetical protein
MKRFLIPVICAITIMLVSCTKESSVEDKELTNPTTASQTGDIFFIQDSLGTQLPAIQFKVDFKWIDSVNAETYVKLHDLTSNAWYHFSTWNILPQVQQMLIPKYHHYDVYWYNYSQQGNSPNSIHKMVIHSATQITDSLAVDNVQRTKLFHDIDYSGNNQVLTNFTITGW